MKRTLILTLVALLSTCSFGQERMVQVGLLRDLSLNRIMLMSERGQFMVVADGVEQFLIGPNDGLRIELTNGRFNCKTLSKNFTALRSVRLEPRTYQAISKVRSLDHKMPDRSYPGGVTLQGIAGRVTLTGQTPIEEYVAGVILSEAGPKQVLEYYKLQSVISRSYLLANSTRHAGEGFEVCDQVHCQVFKGSCKHDLINEAVKATRSMVLVDANIHLIHATFHSNCGGETMNAEDVWSRSESYLQARMDTFCLASPHATWEKVLNKQDWLSYLQRKYGLSLQDRNNVHAVLNYEPLCRDLYLANITPKIPLKTVRSDWQLRSGYFSVRPDGDRVILRGRGFGHGVGMCQEGAMQMALSGKTYIDILHYYYTDVHLIDLKSLDFFRAEGPVGLE